MLLPVRNSNPAVPVLVKTTKLPVRYSYLVVFLLVVNEYGHCPYSSKTSTGTARAPSVPEAALVGVLLPVCGLSG